MAASSQAHQKSRESFACANVEKKYGEQPTEQLTFTPRRPSVSRTERTANEYS